MKSVSFIRFLITASVVLVAALAAWMLWHHYMYSPWTRDARVRAEVVQVAADVSGLISRVEVKDNQQVKKGDVLYIIDAQRFQYAHDQAAADVTTKRAALEVAQADIHAAKADSAAAKATWQMHQGEAQRRQAMGNNVSEEERHNALAVAASAKAAWQASKAALGQARAREGQAKADLERAQSVLAVARLDLARSKVRAPVSGYVTNLDVYPGDYAHAGQSNMALVADQSFWLYAYLEETKLSTVEVGDEVDIKLIGGARFKGHVESIARAIGDSQNPTGTGLLAEVSPTFSWVRLAQRIPVRIAIDRKDGQEPTQLAAGMTATVVIHSDNSRVRNSDN